MGNFLASLDIKSALIAMSQNHEFDDMRMQTYQEHIDSTFDGFTSGAIACIALNKNVSSRTMEDIMSTHDITSLDIYRACWIIENIKDFHTSDIIQTHIIETINRYVTYDAFAATYKTCFAHDATKLHKLKTAITEYERCTSIGKLIYVPIGASGTGKTTASQTFNATRFDYDALRYSLYSENDKYDFYECCEISRNDPAWPQFVDDSINELFVHGVDIWYDSVVTTREEHSFVIDLAKKYDYNVVAVTMPISLEELQYRQLNRIDKIIDVERSIQQYYQLKQPSVGPNDFDFVITLDTRRM